MTKKKLRGRVNRPHSNILQQFNYSILEEEEEEEKERKDQSEWKAHPHLWLIRIDRNSHPY